MLKYKVFLLLIFVSTISCNNNKEEFYRERFLFRYLNDHKVITGATEYNLILINSTDCGACSIKSIEKIEKSFSLKNNLKKYILVTDKGAPYLSSLNLSNLELIECKWGNTEVTLDKLEKLVYHNVPLGWPTTPNIKSVMVSGTWYPDGEYRPKHPPFELSIERGCNLRIGEGCGIVLLNLHKGYTRKLPKNLPNLLEINRG